MSHLHRAARLRQLEEIASCLSAGEDVDRVGIRGFTALMLAAREGHPAAVEQLLGAGANVHLAHPNGRTALHISACAGHLEIVRQLLNHGANPHSVSGGGNTPALEAAQFNHTEVVALLLAHGASPAATDRQGRTAADWLEVGGVQGEAGRMHAQHFRSEAAVKRAEDQVRQLMAQGLTPEEWVAKHGANTLVWSYGAYEMTDPEVRQWARRVAQLLFNPNDLLDE